MLPRVEERPTELAPMEVRQHLDAHFFLSLGVFASIFGIEQVIYQLERFLPAFLLA